jgi:hypothetical protein
MCLLETTHPASIDGHFGSSQDRKVPDLRVELLRMLRHPVLRHSVIDFEWEGEKAS